jgi:hypothetical protein
VLITRARTQPTPTNATSQTLAPRRSLFKRRKRPGFERRRHARRRHVRCVSDQLVTLLLLPRNGCLELALARDFNGRRIVEVGLIWLWAAPRSARTNGRHCVNDRENEEQHRENSTESIRSNKTDAQCAPSRKQEPVAPFHLTEPARLGRGSRLARRPARRPVPARVLVSAFCLI